MLALIHSPLCRVIDDLRRDNDFNNSRSSTSAMSDYLSRSLQLLASGHLDEARIYLEELLRQNPDNPDLLSRCE